MTNDVAPEGFDEPRFSNSLRYEAELPAHKVLDHLKFLRTFDERYEQKAHFWLLMLLPAVLLCGLGILLMVKTWVIPAVFVIAGGVGVGILGVARWAYYSHFDLENRRYELATGLVSLLSNDMGQDTPVAISIDFKPHNDRSKLARKGKVGHWDVQYFSDPWFQLNGRLLDGTTFKLSVIEKQQDRSRKKISASGKTKFKQKKKYASEAIINFKLKEKRYQLSDSLSTNLKATLKALRESGEFPLWVEPKRIDSDGNAITFRTTASGQWDVAEAGNPPVERDGLQWLALSFVAVYRSLQPVKN